MGETPKSAQDERLRTFFREALEKEPGVGGELAARMAERCVGAIDRLLSGAKGPPSADKPLGTPSAGTPRLAFDPFAFSAVALLARHGREALLSVLGEIHDVAHLKALADAQHIAIDPGIRDVAEMRLAVVRGVERRIASRRAAAS